MNADLKWLVERAKIQDVVTRYATSVDQRDWPSLQSVFTESIERDMSAVTGGAPETIQSAQHVAECQATLPGFDSTQHFLLNTDISIDDDRATAVVYMIADHTLVDDGMQKQFTIRGNYTYQFCRSGSDWKVCGMKLDVASTQGDQGIFAAAASRAEAK